MALDNASIREAKRNIARKLASAAFAVLLGQSLSFTYYNPIRRYRDVAVRTIADFAAFIGDGGFRKVGPWREKLTAEAIMRDATGVVAWLDRQDGVDTDKGIGTQGYCMGGPFTIWSAAAVSCPGQGRSQFPWRRAGAAR